MPAIDAIREKLPEAAKDLKLNIQAVLRPENLTADQVWGVALASAYFIGNAELSAALLADAKEAGATDALIDDAKAAASIMGMNTVYYRFRHLVEKPSYSSIPSPSSYDAHGPAPNGQDDLRSHVDGLRRSGGLRHVHSGSRGDSAPARHHGSRCQ